MHGGTILEYVRRFLFSRSMHEIQVHDQHYNTCQDLIHASSIGLAQELGELKVKSVHYFQIHFTSDCFLTMIGN